MKLCKDCKHVEINTSCPENFSKCLRDAKVTPNPISGQMENTGYYWCSSERKVESFKILWVKLGGCGKDGKYFEAR